MCYIYYHETNSKQYQKSFWNLYFRNVYSCIQKYLSCVLGVMKINDIASQYTVIEGTKVQ